MLLVWNCKHNFLASIHVLILCVIAIVHIVCGTTRNVQFQPCNSAGSVQHLQESFDGGPQEIEDLWLPYFCVSTNLSNADVEVHQVGSLWKFVRASMTIVGMLPPVINNGEMLVDGGYLNNVPVDIMHSLGVRHVIVVRSRGHNYQ